MRQDSFATNRQAAAVKIHRAADLIRKRWAAVIEPYGVTFQQYNVLRILRGAGEPVPTLEIGERMIEQTPGITRLLDRLEEKGLVTRQRGAQDRRVYFCSITTEGQRLLAAMDTAVNAADEAAVDPLNDQQVNELTILLGILLDGSA